MLVLLPLTSSARNLAQSISPSRMAIITDAVQLPVWLVIARASDMNLSMPRINAMPATGTSGTTDSDARVM